MVDKNQPLSFYKFFLMPLSFYLCWLIVYFFINFVIAAKRIRERNYDTLYYYYNNQPWANKLLDRKGCLRGPVLFLSFHFVFFFICHCYALLCWCSYYFATFSVVFWLAWSLWNSSCFYMDYFSKKYEASLSRLDQVQQKLEEDSKQPNQQ